jgi:predicted nucleic acid-binding Zn ribbon protein
MHLSSNLKCRTHPPWVLFVPLFHDTRSSHWKKTGNQLKKKKSRNPTASMPTYIYETTDPKKPVRRFEVRQSMKDAPLKKDPETGEPVRRVISGGLGYMSKFNAPKHADMQREMGGDGGSCGSGCGGH